MLLKKKIYKWLKPNSGALLQERIFNEFQVALTNNHSFPNRIELPSDFGKHLPERVIEILLAKLSYREDARVLDLGYANATASHLKMIQTLGQKTNIFGADIARPNFDTTPYYRSSIIADSVHLPFSDKSFDLIWCISTMEHFGMDNSAYTETYEIAQYQDTPALLEMVRLLALGGSILLTVPYGAFEDRGWMRNYDQVSWKKLLAHITPDTETKEWYFRHTYGRGWTEVAPEELQYTGYYDQRNAGAAGLAVAYITKPLPTH